VTLVILYPFSIWYVCKLKFLGTHTMSIRFWLKTGCGSRYRRDHDEEPTVTYQLGPAEEVKVALGGCAWCCVLWRDKRVSAVVADAKENSGAVSCSRQ
jgi:hypothetical protein